MPPRNKASVQIIRADLAVTTSYVVSSSQELGDFDDAVVYINYLNNGAANNIQFYVEYSPDGTNFYRETTEEIDSSTGIINTFQAVRSFLAIATSGQTDSIEFPIKSPDRFMRVAVKETVAAGSAGSVEISVLPLDVASSRPSEPNQI